MSTLILSGSIAPLDTGITSAINKQPISGSVECTFEGLAGDQQADRRHHGGRERALHYYPQEHFIYWKSFWQAMGLSTPATPFKPAAFGENLSDTGLLEDQVHIGDIFTLGEAVIQISQPRSPCFKLNIRFGYPQMSLVMQTTGKTGWLFRVLQPGKVNAGDTLKLQEEEPTRLSVRGCLDTLYNQPYSEENLRRLTDHPALSEGWRQHASNWLNNARADDWSRRLFNQISSSN
ncbi:MAG: MOSC domain-containing protein [Sedimenticola thiotaurini]|uniref:MOSC domain-containing protein n=1 Tax=Sedimenticola thiotaurini TaxID=1543721 RepID=A0A558DFT9_9GAMM|nr:MAG: MOSC domain-containing protein [Sedimenticola thiotaurini]